MLAVRQGGLLLALASAAPPPSKQDSTRTSIRSGATPLRVRPPGRRAAGNSGLPGPRQAGYGHPRLRRVSVAHVAAARGVAAVVAFTGVALLFILDHGGPGEFVYFTTQSNLLVGLCFLAGALGPWLSRSGPPDVVRGAVTLYILVTFLIFHLVLANPASGFSDGAAHLGSIQNILLHTVTPLLALLDWVLIRTRRLRRRWAAAWLAYPLAYLAFALIRGTIVHRYPYPFLDVRSIGYGGVTVVSLGLFVVFWLLGLVVVLLGRDARRSAVPAAVG